MQMHDSASHRNEKACVTRRRFLGISLASGVALLAGKSDVILGADTATSSNMATNPTFNLAVISLSIVLVLARCASLAKASGAGRPDRQNALKVLRRAVELGVNLMDTADAYGPDTSELLIAEALYPYPKGLVIATKAASHAPAPVNGYQTAGLTTSSKHSMEV